MVDEGKKPSSLVVIVDYLLKVFMKARLPNTRSRADACQESVSINHVSLLCKFSISVIMFKLLPRKTGNAIFTLRKSA